jgi:hypothetical protein
MQYQISLSPAYALGIPEAGNVLSLSYSIILGLFIIGFIRDWSGNESLALLIGLGAVVGAYEAVWHTTEGPHAIGELSLLIAVCGSLWPRSLLSTVKPIQCGFLIVTSACLAASTKISLLPVCAVISLFAVWLTYSGLKIAGRGRIRAGIALLPWLFMYLPLMLWTFHESGSFWGPVLANVFRPSIFPKDMLGILDRMREVNQRGLLTNIRFAAVELSPFLFVGIGFVIWGALRKSREAVLILALLVFQGALILSQLPYDFRFFGGLIYVPLIAAALSLANSRTNGPPATLTYLGDRVVRLRNWIALAAIVPWLLFQIYYSRPFIEEVTGISSKQQFRDRYIGLTEDYKVLDQLLPPNAVLYITAGRVSLFDAPRPVVLTPLDLRQKSSIYKLTFNGLPEKEVLDATSVLVCDQIVYSNQHAVIETYRLPGRLPQTGAVSAKSCHIERGDSLISLAVP